MCEHAKVSNKVSLLPHNQELYGKIVEQINKGEKSIFFSQATGLGKSFIFMKLVEDYFQGKQIMYIVPKIAIWENLIHHKEFQTLNATIDMFTYQSFNNYDTDLVEQYDVVFIDECHHMLSDIQGTNIMTYCLDMNSQDKFTFGFTATPYYQGKYVDEECFDVSCYGYDVYEAIDLRILPKIKLALANIDLDKVPDDLKIQYSITGTKPLLDRIIEEHKEITRWLAYFTNSKELELRAHELKILFPGYRILKTYVGYEFNDYAMKEFNSCTDKVILLSVNKLLEGVHLKNVQGVLLYRNVTEFSTYMQMYGRLCDLNAKVTPLFVDVTNAILSFSGSSETKSSRFVGERKRYKRKDLFDMTIRDYWTVELSDILSTIMYHKSPEFVDKVIDLYKDGKTMYQVCKELGESRTVIYRVLRKHAPEFIIDSRYQSEELNLIRTLVDVGLSSTEIMDKVNEFHRERGTGIIRTSTGIDQVINKKFGPIRQKSEPFSPDETKILELYGDDMSIPELRKLLPGKSYGAIYYRLKCMGKGKTLSTTLFDIMSEEDVRQLHKRYLKGAKIGVLSKEVGVSRTSLERAWRKLGLVTRLNYTQIFSLPENLDILKSCWAKPNRQEIIAEQFPEVSPITLYKMANKLGLIGYRKQLSDNEVQVIRDCIIKNKSTKDICVALNNLEENKSIGITRNFEYVRVLRTQIRQELLCSGFSDKQLSTDYTDEEDTIVLKFASGEIGLEEATSLVNNLQFNKDRNVTRDSTCIISRRKRLLSKRRKGS